MERKKGVGAVRMGLLVMALFFIISIVHFPAFAERVAIANTTAAVIESGTQAGQINLTVVNQEFGNGKNITNVTIELPANFTFISGTNVSNVSLSAFFSNTSAAGRQNLTLWNVSASVPVLNISLTTNQFELAFNVSSAAGIQQENITVHIIHWSGTDVGFNVTNVTVSVTDTIRPSAIAFLSPTPTVDGYIPSRTPAINLTFTEVNFANCTFQIFNQSGAPQGQNFTNSTNINGSTIGGCILNSYGTQNDNAPVNVTVFVFDTAGQANSSPNRNFTIDAILPSVVSFLSPTPSQNSVIPAAQPVINVRAADNNFANCTIQVFNQSAAAGQNFSNATLVGASCLINDYGVQSDGDVNATGFVFDVAGNIATAPAPNRKFTIDTTRPSGIAFLSPTPDADSFTGDSTPLINISFTETNFNNCTLQIFNASGAPSGQNFTNSTNNSGSCLFNAFGDQADGEVNFTVFVNDQAARSNSTPSRNITIDTVRPTISLSLPSSSFTAGDAVTISCSFSDSRSGIQSSGVSVAGPAGGSTTVACGGQFTGQLAGTYTVTASATDKAGNSGSQSATFTVAARLTSGDSPSGTGRSAAASKFWDEIAPGAPLSIVVAEEGISISRIEFASTARRTSVGIKVTGLPDKPSAISPEPDGQIYQYVDIQPANIGDEAIETATIEFIIPQSWIAAYHIDRQGVSLHRYTGRWEKLPTLLVSETASEFVYQAETPGFSTFAIAGLPESAGQKEEPGPLCAPGERRCSGNTLQECGEDGTAFIDREWCADGCSEGACRSPDTVLRKEKPEQDILLPVAAAVIILLLGLVLYLQKGALVQRLWKRRPVWRRGARFVGLVKSRVDSVSYAAFDEWDVSYSI